MGREAWHDLSGPTLYLAFKNVLYEVSRNGQSTVASTGEPG